MKKIILLFFVLNLLLFVSSCSSDESTLNLIEVEKITSEDCYFNGGEIVESNSCQSGFENLGKVRGEDFFGACCVKIDSKNQNRISFEEAYAIASKSECINEGNISSEGVYNEYTNTWWIDIIMNDTSSCNPSCVVLNEKKIATINWRCNGAMLR